MVSKIKNKIHGYHCDRCKVVPKVIYADETGFLCEQHANDKHGAEVIKALEFEED